MKTISDFTIYCTKAQTRRALELGAPIEHGKYCSELNADIFYKDKDGMFKKKLFTIPAAEQMIGWLEEQGLFISIQRIKCQDKTFDYYYVIEHDDIGYLTDGLWTFDSPKEATLAAIDAALGYYNKK